MSYDSFIANRTDVTNPRCCYIKQQHINRRTAEILYDVVFLAQPQKNKQHTVMPD